jgi:hypothetical protein
MIYVRIEDKEYVTVWNPATDEIRLRPMFQTASMKTLPLPEGEVSYRPSGKQFFTKMVTDEFVDFATDYHQTTWAEFLKRKAPELFATGSQIEIVEDLDQFCKEI